MSGLDRVARAEAPRHSSMLNYIVEPADRPKADRDQNAGREGAVTPERVGDFLEIDLRRVFVWLKSGLKIALVFALVGAVLAAAYGLMGARRYTVSSEILIEPASIQVINNDLYTPVQQQGEGQALAITNRARLMTSGNVLARVVEKLDLGNDQEFYKPPRQGPFSSLSGGSGGPAPDRSLAALKALQQKIDLTVDGRSFIVVLSVSAETSDKAIAISNAIVEAFNAELAGSEAEGARRAAAALDERLAALKANAIAAEEAVEDFRRKNGLATGENGQLVTSQTMTQTNAQLSAARTRVIEAQANYNALSRATDGSVATIPGVSDTLRDLKLRAGTLEQQLSAQQTIYGQRHPSIARTQSELNAAREQIRAELRRATNVAKAELDKANEALRQLGSNMADLQNSAFDEGQSQVELRELQRDALAKTQIYESFLVRVRQIAERERITTDNVRVVTPPLPPSGRSWPPRTALLFVIGGMLGFMLGLGIALVRGIVADMRGSRPLRADW